MIKKRHIPVLFVGVLLALSLLIFAGHALGAVSPAVHVQVKHTQGQPGDVPGVPGIVPSMPGKIPAFTEADVRAYIHRFPFAAGIDDSKISKVLFIPSSEAATLMKGAETGIADNEVVCYVEFDNINVALQVPRPAGAPAPVVHTGQIVFNAATGNELVYGGL